MDRGVLYFRGHVVTTIAFHHDYESILYLLVNDRLPNPTERDTIYRSMQKVRSEFKANHSDVLNLDSTSCEYALQCLAVKIDEWIENESLSLYESLLRFVSLTPLVITGHWRLFQGLDLVAPTEKYGHSGNVLHTMGFEVDFVDLQDFDAGLILHMDDPDNPSLTQLLNSLENGDKPGEAIRKAIRAHVGPLHHGAGSNAMRMIEELRDVENLPEYLRNRIRNGEKLFGLGHRIYRTIDPRAVLLKKILLRRTKETEHEWIPPVIEEVAMVGAEMILEMKGRDVFPNVDLYNAAVYSTLGFPIEFNTYLFAISRAAGWMAHTLDLHRKNPKT